MRRREREHFLPLMLPLLPLQLSPRLPWLLQPPFDRTNAHSLTRLANNKLRGRLRGAKFVLEVTRINAGICKKTKQKMLVFRLQASKQNDFLSLKFCKFFSSNYDN